MEDELTEEMHSKISISEADEIKHRCWAALLAIEAGLYTRKSAVQTYCVTPEQIDEYEAEYRRLEVE